MVLQDLINALFLGLPAWVPTAIAMTGMGAGILTLLFRPRGRVALRAAAIGLVLCQVLLYLVFA
ncbi:MAG: hypothetical protein AAGG11_21935 [Pseudomonadota bacterium]